MVRVGEGGDGGALGEDIDVEGFAGALDGVDDVARAEAITHADAGETVCFAEGSEADDVFAFADVGGAIGVVREVFGELEIGFVEDGEGVLGEVVEEGIDF